MRKPASPPAAGRILAVSGLLLFILILQVASSASAEWMTWETEHFLIHFHSDLEAVAWEVAARADNVHDALVTRIGHMPRQKTHIVITDRTDAANASATPLFENRIVLYPAFPGLSTAHLSGFDLSFSDWLTLLITHEYAHILQMDMQSPASEALTSVLGRVPFLATPLLLAPPLVLEGFAVLQESADGNGRGNSSYYRMFLRTAALEGTLPELDQVIAEYPLDRWQPGGHIYFYGFEFLNYLVRRFGPDTLHRLNEYLKRRPDSLSRAVLGATGTPLRVLWQEWREEVTARAREEAREIGKQPLTEVHVVDTAGYHVLFPTPAPRDSRVAYVAVGGVVPALRLWDRGEQKEISLATLQGVLTNEIAWHPDGNRLIAAVLRTDWAGNTLTHLVEIDTDTGAVTPLPRTDRAFSPSYDPKGERLVYLVRSGHRITLRIRDLRTGTDVVLIDDPEITPLSVTWSPTDQQLALAVWLPGVGTAIALCDPADGSLEPVVGGGASYQSPGWTPDGRTLLFSSDRDGVFNVYAYELDTKKVLRLTRTLSGLFHPRLTHDNVLTASYYTSDGYRLVTMPYRPEAGTPEPAWLAGQPHVAEPPGVPRIIRETAYSPWPSLAPKFWLPSVQYVADDAYLGVATAGQDVLGRTAYNASLSLGLSTGRLGYRVDVEQALDEGGMTTAVFGTNRLPAVQRLHGEWVWLVSNEAYAGLRRLYPITNGSHELWTRLRGVQGPYVYGTDAKPAVKYRVEGGWRFVQTGGRLSLRAGRSVGLSLAVDAGDSESWTAVWQHVEEIQGPRREGVALTFNLGVAGREDQLRQTGYEQLFALRGFPDRQWNGHVLARLSAEATIPVWQVKRGMIDAPLFFDRVAVHPFVEGGFAADRSTGAQQRTGALGAELGVVTYLGYGVYAVDWRFGLAYGTGRDAPHLYLRVTTQL